jgi:Zn-dependent protease
MRFTVFGIPVTAEPFFLLGLVLIWQWAGGDRAGLFAALLVGIFTLIHELGHAITARRFGAAPAITLNLLVGWASYSSARPFSRKQRNIVSLAGPLTQIAASIPVLWASYAALPAVRTTADVDRVLNESLAFDLWVGAVWAGIIIGLLNLLPLWPLDGGHVVDSFLGGAFGERRGRRVMLIGTLVAVGVVTVLGVVAQNPTTPLNPLERQVVEARSAPLLGLLSSSFPEAVWQQVKHFPGNVLDFPFLLLIFCGLNSVLALRALPRHDRVATWMDVAPAQPPPKSARRPSLSPVPPAAIHAERTGWLESTLPPFPSGWGPSPWLRAALALQAGDRDTAVQWLGQVTTPGRPRWTLPDPSERPELAALTPLLPSPLPLGDADRNMTLIQVLAAHGTPEQIAVYGNAAYRARPAPEILYQVAAGLGRAGHGDEAMAWLRRAVQDLPDHQRLATDRGLWPLHSRPDFQQLLAETRSGY